MLALCAKLDEFSVSRMNIDSPDTLIISLRLNVLVPHKTPPTYDISVCFSVVLSYFYCCLRSFPGGFLSPTSSKTPCLTHWTGAAVGGASQRARTDQYLDLILGVDVY